MRIRVADRLIKEKSMNKSSWALLTLWAVVLVTIELLVKGTTHSTLVITILAAAMLLNQAIHVFSCDGGSPHERKA